MSHSHSHDHETNLESSHGHNQDHSDALASTETRSLLTRTQPEVETARDRTAHDEVRQQAMVLRRLKTASFLCVTFLLVEVIGGWLAGSLAILSDAAHLLADLAAFVVAIAAAHLASLPSTESHTFGLKRMESLAALFSMVSLALVSVGLAVEAVRRLVKPPEEPVDGPLMSGVAAVGVVVNVILAFVLGEHHVHLPGGHDHDHSHEHSHGHDHGHHETHEEHHGEQEEGNGTHDHDHHHHDEENGDSHPHHHGNYGAVLHSDELTPPHTARKPPRNINLHAAYLHVLGDLAQSVAVLIAGLVIWWKPTWGIVDPLCTLFFCALVFYSTLGVLRSSISVLLEEVPPHLSWTAIHQEMEDIAGVISVHDLHVWSISHGIPTLSVHIMANGKEQTRTAQQVLQDVYQVCQQYGIEHATVQVQCEGEDCITCTGQPTGRPSRCASKILTAHDSDSSY